MSVIIGRVKRPGYSSTINLKDLESYTLYDNEPTRNGLCQILWTGKPVVFGCGG